MKKIKYVSYYAEAGNPQNRNIVLAATNKIDYICEALNNLGYEVYIISASGTRDKDKFHKGRFIQLGEKKFLRTFFTFPWGSKFQKLLSILSCNMGVFLELLKTKKGEKVLVYHSLGYMNLINLLHRIKKFHLILETEEIYSDVIGNEKLRKKEVEYLRSADSYIFPTKLLNEELNVKDKPAIYIHGTYRVEEDRKCKIFEADKQNKDKLTIHCVYAGTFDPQKGAKTAVAAATYLPACYHIHIIGFGNKMDTENIKIFITKIAKESKAKVTYDGLLSGEDYIQFIQNCDIGLSTQNPDAAFNSTSFPSKILSYLANGLRVVSIRIPAIEQSAVGNRLFYYDIQTPEEVAKAILSVDMSTQYDSRQLISYLAKDFEQKLSILLGVK